MLKRLGSLVVLALSFSFAFSLLGAPAASAQGAVTDAPEVAARLLQLVNAERQSAGLPALVARDDVAAIAGPHSAQMAAAHNIWHNDAYFTSATRSKLNAKGLGENVGMNATAEAAHQAFMDSPGHRANVMNASFTVAGFGAARDERGYLYVTENFVTPNSPKAAPAPAPAPAAPAPAPAPAAPVAKAAPVTVAKAAATPAKAAATPAPAPVAAPAPVPAPEVTVPPAPTTTEAPAPVALPATLATAPAAGFSLTSPAALATAAGAALVLLIAGLVAMVLRRSATTRVVMA